MRAVVLLATAAALCGAVSAEQWYVAKSSAGVWSVSKTMPVPFVAEISYVASMKTIGWDQLNVSTMGANSDVDQAYGAGYGEGFVTYSSIVDAYNSYGGPSAQGVIDFLDQNWQYMNATVAAKGATDPYWHNVGLEMQQFQGLLDGINAQNAAKGVALWTPYMLHTIVSQGDLYILQSKWPLTTSQNWRTMDSTNFAKYFHHNTHCSALFKVTPGLEDILFGHATWASFSTLFRSFKNYFFNYNGLSGAGVASRHIAFSGYPGTITSTDDFYVTDTKLAIIETTNNIFNESLYDLLTPNSLLYWVRLKVATRMSTSAKQWMQLFGEQNSGTYNNQWMVLDMNKFTPHQDLQPETFYVGEQAPGLWQYADLTRTLAYGYWPSYNVAYFKEMFAYCGYPEGIQLQGSSMLAYETCARAEIFRREHSNATTIAGFINTIQYNHYESDPYSDLNPVHSIAARGDLLPVPQCFGALDAKVSSFTMQQQRAGHVMAWSGPTPQQGVLNWSTVHAPDMDSLNCRHFGQPEVFNFGFQDFFPF